MKNRVFTEGIITVVLAALLVFTAVPAFAAEAAGDQGTVRTVLMYDCGSNLETDNAMASYNLKQILRAKYSANDKVKVIVMTGGANKWQMESKYLYDPASGTSPEAISGEYNQIWEAMGADAGADQHAGQMILRDGDGVMGDGNAAKKSEEEPMPDPATLKAFINYGVRNYPAEKYDLILWDHGGGPTGGFGLDEHVKDVKTMSLSEIIDAVSDNDVIRNAGAFDFIDFDACLMSSAELVLTLADYTDYYIASPQTEPGYGQDYEGWLTKLGQEPGFDTFQLGRIIVDDFIKFYETGEGKGQDATLTVIDMQKLVKSDFVPALTELDQILRSQATIGAKGQYLFYDELRSASKSILYMGTGFYDLGNMAQLLAVTEKEVDDEVIAAWEKDEYLNPYTDVSKRILTVLGDSNIIYGRGTDGIQAEEQLVRDKNGELGFKKLRTSGMYMFFPPADTPKSAVEYYDELVRAIDRMPAGAADRKAFLTSYLHTVIDYALLAETGSDVSTMRNILGKETSEINYDTVKKDYWQMLDEEGDSVWKNVVQPLLDRNGGEAASRAWLTQMIKQQKAEMVSLDHVSAYKVGSKQGTGSRVVISNTRKRVVESTEMKIVPELPVAKEFLEKDPKASGFYKAIPDLFDLTIGTVSGEKSYDDFDNEEEDIYGAWLKWYNSDTSVWDLSPETSKWYAVKDRSGSLHVASVMEDEETVSPFVEYKDEAGESKSAYLVFQRGKDKFVLDQIVFNTGTVDQPIFKVIKASDLKVTMHDVMPSMNVSFFGMFTFVVPMSRSTFEITPEDVRKGSIRLIYTDTGNIPDIGAVDYRYTVTDIYGTGLDITDKVRNPLGTLVDIGDAKINSAVYNGEDQDPVVTYQGKVLTKGTDYTVIKSEPCRDVGKHMISVRGMGAYTKSLTTDFRIDPKGTALKKVKRASGNAVTVKWKKQSGKMSVSRVTGYQIRYSTNKSMKSAKKVTVKGYQKTSTKIGKLKKNRKYYFQVRTYMKTKNGNVYSGWSGKKAVK